MGESLAHDGSGLAPAWADLAGLRVESHHLTHARGSGRQVARTVAPQGAQRGPAGQPDVSIRLPIVQILQLGCDAEPHETTPTLGVK